MTPSPTGQPRDQATVSGADGFLPPPPEVSAAEMAARLATSEADAAPAPPPKPPLPAAVAAARFDAVVEDQPVVEAEVPEEEPVVEDEEVVEAELVDDVPEPQDDDSAVMVGDIVPEDDDDEAEDEDPVDDDEDLEPADDSEPDVEDAVPEPAEPEDVIPEAAAPATVVFGAAEPGPEVELESERTDVHHAAATAVFATPALDQADPDGDHISEDAAPAASDSRDLPALTLTGVSKSFGQTRAVDRVDLAIPAGTFYGIVGPNGAGKTTTLSMIAGLLRPDAGGIHVGGIDLQRDPRAAKARMGVLPDRLRTFDRLTGRQLLHYYGVLRGLRPAVVAERTTDLARAFDLTAALTRPVSDYSAGMTKKIMLAGAMIHAPRLLVLDEPFESVDPVSSAVILDILAAFVSRGGTVVLSSHGMDLVERVCHGVAVIVSGQVLAQGTVDEVRGDHTLAERFVQLSGGLSDVEGLEWLHTYSD